MNIISLSQNLLDSVQKKEDPTTSVQQLAELARDELNTLKTDTDKKAFWINIYNSFSMILLKGNPEKILSQIGRLNHFGSKKVIIANQRLSLNDIEHGILRRSKIWWSYGYFKKILVPAFEKKHRTNKLDNRIHFALNCGGWSCPNIRFYCNKDLERQLEQASNVFLHSEAKYEPTSNTLSLNKIFSWYIGDFGGKKGLINFLRNRIKIPTTATPTIKYEPYSWEPYLEKFNKY